FSNMIAVFLTRISIVQVARLRGQPGAPQQGRGRLHVFEVRILEKGGVLQAETKHTVETQVGHPDQSEGGKLRRRQREGNQQEHYRAHIRVHEIVASYAPLGVDEVTQHEEIRRQKQKREQAPREMTRAIK